MKTPNWKPHKANQEFITHSIAQCTGKPCCVHNPSDHHFACDCREAVMAESMQTQRRVIDWRDQSDEGLRLRCGELTTQEIRTIRAVLGDILPPNAKLLEALEMMVDGGLEGPTEQAMEMAFAAIAKEKGKP